VAPRDRHPALHVVWKPSANYPDDCRRSECVVSFCSQDRLTLVVRRWRKFSLGLSLLNLEVAKRQIQTPESISHTFERWGPQLRLICDRNQTVRCPCIDGMVIPWLAAIALVWDFLISRAGWLSLPHLPDAAKEPGRSRASNPDPDQKNQHSSGNHLKSGAEKRGVRIPLANPVMSRSSIGTTTTAMAVAVRKDRIKNV
jgi:hypothetical protein